MSRSNIEYIKHAVDEIEFLEKQLATISKDRFVRDEVFQHAFARSLEIIGESIKQIPDEVRNKYPDVDWKSFSGLRDKLIHHYFGVDYEIVWDVVVNELPDLKLKLKKVIEKETVT
jgi:uncharacterized protein with HEPN domain